MSLFLHHTSNRRMGERMYRPSSDFTHANQVSSASGTGHLHRGSCYCSDHSFGDWCQCTPALSVDIVIERRDGAAADGALVSLLMMKRFDRSGMAIVGGYVEIDESVEDAAIREVHEETGLVLTRASLRQLHVFSDPSRDPRRHTVSTTFVARVRTEDSTLESAALATAATGSGTKGRGRLRAHDDAKQLVDVSISEAKALIASKGFAFDHGAIVEYYLSKGIQVPFPTTRTLVVRTYLGMYGTYDATVYS